MNTKRRTSLIGGMVLILFGALFLILQLIPGLYVWFSWPWIIIGVGVFLLVIGSATGEPDMAIPACIVGGIGALLYYQDLTGDWDSWAYAWTLMPGFVGLGIFLSGLLGGKRESLREGGWLILISLGLFAAFGSFFGAIGLVGDYWPVLLILLGLLLLIRPLLRSR